MDLTTRPTNVPRLPFDILSEVAAHCPRPTIAKLMQTCYTLYTDGPRHLLRGGVVLYEAVNVISFVNFMFARDNARFSFLRKLHIAIGTMTNHALEERLLKLFSSPYLFLDALIFSQAKTFFSSHSYLCDAIRNPMSIKHLGLHYAGHQACSKIGAMTLHLTTATISLKDPTRDSTTIGTIHREIEFSVIASSSRTLQKLSLNIHPATSAPGASFPSYLSDSHLFPAMRAFSIVCDVSFPECVLAAPIARAFPNLSTLYLVPSQYPTTARCPTSDLRLSIDRTRLQNLQGQILRPGGLWPGGLDEYGGELLSLYTLGLTCTVSTLRVWKRLDTVMLLPFLRSVLEDARPTHLFLSIYGLDVLDGFLSILRDMEMETLRSIQLNYSSRPLDDEGGVPYPTNRTTVSRGNSHGILLLGV